MDEGREEGRREAMAGRKELKVGKWTKKEEGIRKNKKQLEGKVGKKKSK